MKTFIVLLLSITFTGCVVYPRHYRTYPDVVIVEHDRHGHFEHRDHDRHEHEGHRR